MNSARAASINVGTWKRYNLEVQRMYISNLQDRHARQYKNKVLSNKQQAEVQAKFAEDQRRWRENPTSADIASGDALNALAIDLADASIAPSAWRSSPVEMPEGLSLTSLAFKIVDPGMSKLLQSTVAIDHMRVANGWPIEFRRPELDRERAAYEKAVTTVIAKCQKRTPLQAKDYDTLRDTVDALAMKVSQEVPTRDGQRGKATEFVRRYLDHTTKIFAEQSFAEQLIHDVSEHKATTVAELLAFMREYRLLFSDPGSSPDLARIYNGLYQLLRMQQDAIGPRNVDENKPAARQKTGRGNVAKGDPRRFWRSPVSTFENIEPRKWLQSNINNGVTFHFDEIGRNRDHVEMVDKTRGGQGIFIRLKNGNSQIKVPAKSADWKPFQPAGKWAKAQN